MTLITHTAADTQLLLAWFYWQMAGGLQWRTHILACISQLTYNHVISQCNPAIASLLLFSQLYQRALAAAPVLIVGGAGHIVCTPSGVKEKPAVWLAKSG